jgi:hypothetical protein
VATYTVKGMDGLQRLLAQHQKARLQRIERAVRRAAQRGAAHVRRSCPVAFGDVRSSINVVDGRRIVADAPHAAALEEGSRPHFPPIEPLERWVKLRGMQGLVADASRGHLPGSTTEEHATNMAAALAGARTSGGFTPVDAPRRIAFMIARKIARYGTKPTHYMRSAVPVVEEFLADEITAALPDP